MIFDFTFRALRAFLATRFISTFLNIMKKVATKSIILNRTPFGEADWIVHFFSRDFGRMSGIAKAARKSVKRFGSGLEPGAIAMVTYTARSNSNLVRLEESRVLYSTTGMMSSLQRIEALGRTLKIASSFLREHQTSTDKFDLMESYLKYISNEDPSQSARIAFELKWLALAGFEPSLKRCVSCGVIVEGDCTFSIAEGGVLCGSCDHSDRNSKTLSHQVCTSMKELLAKPLGSEIPIEGCEKISSLLDSYSEYILGFTVSNWSASK